MFSRLNQTFHPYSHDIFQEIRHINLVQYSKLDLAVILVLSDKSTGRHKSWNQVF